MATIIQVLEVINSMIISALKKIMPAFLILSFGIVFIASFKIYPLSAFMIAFVWWKMLKEDFCQHTIDLRLLGAMFLLILFSVQKAGLFIIGCIFSFFVFKLLFYANVKINNAPITTTSNATQTAAGIKYGYLPALGISLYSYLWFKEIYNPAIPPVLIPTHRGISSIADYCLDNYALLIIIAIAWTAVLFVMEYRIRNAVKTGKSITYGFGNGDPLVLSVFGGLLGIEQMTVVFFISLLASIFLYVYHSHLSVKRRGSC